VDDSEPIYLLPNVCLGTGHYHLFSLTSGCLPISYKWTSRTKSVILWSAKLILSRTSTGTASYWSSFLKKYFQVSPAYICLMDVLNFFLFCCLSLLKLKRRKPSVNICIFSIGFVHKILFYFPFGLRIIVQMADGCMVNFVIEATKVHELERKTERMGNSQCCNLAWTNED
jgi:hypothetical protein